MRTEDAAEYAARRRQFTIFVLARIDVYRETSAVPCFYRRPRIAKLNQQSRFERMPLVLSRNTIVPERNASAQARRDCQWASRILADRNIGASALKLGSLD